MTTESEGGAVLTRAHVVDVNMPFSSMVGFILKSTLASIPAILILVVLGFVISAVFAGLLAGIRPSATNPAHELSSRIALTKGAVAIH